MKTVTFPRIGREYSKVFTEMLNELDMNVISPPPINEEILKFGVKHSSDMVCVPFKYSLGSLWHSIQNGADTLLQWDTKGRCRERHYWIMQKHILENLGYDVDFIPMNLNVFRMFRKMNPKLGYFKILRVVRKYWKKLREIDEKRRVLKEGMTNIGIIGEVYVCVEESVNYHLDQKLRDLDVNPYHTVNLSDFLWTSLEHKLKIHLTKRKWKKKAKKYLNGPIGGHAYESIYNLEWMIDHGIDGIIHLLPLSCAPETMVEPVINSICSDNDIPLLRLPIDETNSEANVETRVEAFVELIKRRDKHVLGS